MIEPAGQPDAASRGGSAGGFRGGLLRGRRWRWVRRGGVAAGVGLVVLVVAGVWFTRPAQLTPFVAERLSRMTGAAVTVDEARLGRGGRLALEGVAADVPGLPSALGGYARVFDAERVSLRLGVWGLLWGRVAVEELAMVEPRLHLVEDLDAGRLNVELLSPPRDGGRGLRLPPAVEIHGARVIFKRLAGGELETIDTMRLEGGLREAQRGSGRYEFALRELGDAGKVESTLAGAVDLQGMGLILVLEGFSVDRPHRYLVPSAFRSVWDTLDPRGGLPTLSLTLGRGPGGSLSLMRAVLELDGLSITPPYEALGLMPAGGVVGDVGAEPYYPRMREVTGRFVVDRERLRVEGLSGVIEGVRYAAEGVWPLAAGGAGSGAGRLSVSTEPFEVERDPRYLAALPGVGLNLFERFSPAGRFSVGFTIEQPPGGSARASGVVEVIDASAVYEKFPYPVEHLTGRVRFDPDAVRIEGLRGRGPGGGVITADGVIAPPGDGAGVDLEITAHGVPLDERALAALPDRARGAVSRFFDRDLYRQLIDEGVIQPGEAPGPTRPVVDGSPPPSFELGGEVSVGVTVHRPPGADRQYEVVTRVDVGGVRALLKDWPYPLVGRSGRVVVDRDAVAIEAVELAGLTGGRATVNGRIDLSGGDRPPTMQVEVTGAVLPLDPLLLHAVRSPARARLAELNAAGRFEGGGRLFRDTAEGNLDWLFAGSVVDGAVRPYGGRFTIDAVTGRAILDRYSLTLSEVTGRRGDARFEVLGRFDWGPGGAVALSVLGSGLAVEPALVDLLPPGSGARARVERLLREYAVRGGFDARLRVETAGAGAAGAGAAAAPTTVQLTVEPKRLGVDWRGRRLEAQEMAGRALVTPGRVDLQGLSGRAGGARFSVDGLVGLDGATDTALSFTADADAADDTARAVLPAAVAAVLDRLAVSGPVRVTDARFLRRVAPPKPAGQVAGDAAPQPPPPAPGPDPPPFELDATVQLDGLTLNPGLPVTGLHGTLRTAVRGGVADALPRLKLELDADRLRVADRLVQPLRLRLDNADAADRLDLRECVGGVYGGLLVGEGTVSLAPPRDLTLSLTLTGAAVGPLLDPPPANPVGDADPAAAPPSREPYVNLHRDPRVGTAAASLDLRVPLDNAAARRGRGAIALRDDTLYDRPVATSLLRAVNFTLPSGSPLDALDARYVLDGDLITLDAIRFSGPGLEVVGGGTVTLPGRELDLTLVSRDTNPLDLGPLTDLVNLVKDEMLTLRVGGTLTEPEARLVTLRGLRQTWAAFFNPEAMRPGERDNIIAGPVGPR